MNREPQRLGVIFANCLPVGVPGVCITLYPAPVQPTRGMDRRPGPTRLLAARVQDSCVLDFTGGTFVKLDLGFTPSPSGGGLCLLQAEEVHDVFVTMYGYTPGLDAADRQEATALVTVMGLSQSVFGYPNEEAFWFDSRGDVGHGFYEVQDSAWNSNLLEYNKRTYGSRHKDWAMHGEHEQPRHFFVGSKDVSAQFLAQGLRVECFTDRPERQVRDEAMRRIDNWWHWQHRDGRPADPGATLVSSYPEIPV